MRILVGVLVSAGVVFAGTPGPPASKHGPAPLSPAEIVKLIEASPREYAIDSEPRPYPQWRQQNAQLTWPESHPPTPMPAFKTLPDGSRTVVTFSGPDEVNAMIKEVERLFGAHDFAGAEKGYEKILAKYPGEYSVQLGYGDAALFPGDAGAALPRYEKATSINPADHRSWYYRGSSLAVLGRKKEAIEAWARALSMRPDYANMILGIERRSDTLGLGYVVRARSLMPSARVTVTRNGAKISSVVVPHWLSWGLCKAMWRIEPAHRKVMTGSETDTFSMIEEKECLMSLVSAYSNRKKGEDEDPVVEQLIAAIDADLFTGYLVFEVASRVEPHAFLLQSPEVQAQVEEYVRRFVLVPK